MKFAKSILIATLALGATALTAFSQTNISLPNTQPYYSISNIVTANGGYLIANDQINGGQHTKEVERLNKLHAATVAAQEPINKANIAKRAAGQIK